MSEEQYQFRICAVVEVEAGRFDVAYPGEVDAGKPLGLLSTPGHYASHNYMIVRGGKEMGAVPLFRNRVIEAVGQAQAPSLDCLQEVLEAAGYKVERQGEIGTSTAPSSLEQELRPE